MSTWHSVMADREEFILWKISKNTVDGNKTDTKCAHSVHGRPTLKDEERFRNGLVCKPCERSLYERTFMSEPFIEKYAISTELCNVNREKHKLKGAFVWDQSGIRIIGIMQVSVCLGAILIPE